MFVVSTHLTISHSTPDDLSWHTIVLQIEFESTGLTLYTIWNFLCNTKQKLYIHFLHGVEFTLIEF